MTASGTTSREPAPLRRQVRTAALEASQAAGEVARAADKLESALLHLADYASDRDAELAELRDEILALSNRIESVYRALNARTEHLA